MHVHIRTLLLAAVLIVSLPSACSGSIYVGAPVRAQARGADAAGPQVYKVGPTRTHKTLSAVAPLLAPGDVVELDGGVTYPGGVHLARGGREGVRTNIRGVRVGGKRPVISGGVNTLEVSGDHIIVEGLELTGGSSRCLFHRAHDVVIRDVSVHDCPAHGILGADAGAGSLTVEYVEVYRCGSGIYKHQVYMATDETAHPGSVFRLQHSYIHDGIGGNAVKSRAERNEVYYNWIEGALYRELELIGPDGQPPALAREDSDVVGNVLYKRGAYSAVRIGGDGTGETNGRYRFVHNTFVLAKETVEAIRLDDGVESIELHNNVFIRAGGGPLRVLTDTATWAAGAPLIAGQNNAVQPGSTFPIAWRGTVVGDPLVIDPVVRDLRPSTGSRLLGAAAPSPVGIQGRPLDRTLAEPVFHPPPGRIEPPGAAQLRPVTSAPDIGAFEL